MTGSFDRFEGVIAGAAFRRPADPVRSSGSHDVVIGCWARSTLLGRPFVDVMWVDPDGRRTLLAPDERVREFLTGVYAFDDARVVALRGGWDGRRVVVEAPPLQVRLEAGRRTALSWLFAVRPRALLRRPAWVSLEDRLARPLVGRLLGGAQGVRAAGVTPGGRREWYGAADWRPVVSGSLRVAGADGGHLSPGRPNLGVGLSSFPRRPAVVNVITTIERARTR